MRVGRLQEVVITLCLCFKMGLCAKPFIEKVFDLHENEHVSGKHFHMNGFARRFVLTQRQKATPKWPVYFNLAYIMNLIY